MEKADVDRPGDAVEVPRVHVAPGRAERGVEEVNVGDAPAVGRQPDEAVLELQVKHDRIAVGGVDGAPVDGPVGQDGYVELGLADEPDDEPLPDRPPVLLNRPDAIERGGNLNSVLRTFQGRT